MRQLGIIASIFLLFWATANAVGVPMTPRKIDEFGSICCGDEKARLDNYAVELQSDPTAQGYIVVYGGRAHSDPNCRSSRRKLPLRGEAQARAARLKSYLVNARRGLASERVIVIDGGYRDHWVAELWIVPKGVNAPDPTPTVDPAEIKFRKGKARSSDYVCEV
jgi:hypothetical protein